MLAALGVLGQAVHLVAYYALNRVLAARGGRTEAAEVLIAAESDTFLLSLFLPFFFALLCFIPQAIGLRRARVIPLWACLSIVAANDGMDDLARKDRKRASSQPLRLNRRCVKIQSSSQSKLLTRC